MAYFDTTWYCNFGNGASTGYYAVAPWGVGATIAAGALRRQLAAPSVGNERVFAAIVGGTTGGAEPAWVLTRGAKTTDNTVTWQECTGASAVNGDLTNTPSWSGVTGGLATAITLGAIIKRNSAASYWICSTAGTTGAAEPSWPNNTAGTTQTDGSVTWTCLGAVGNFTGGQAPHARLANACASGWFVSGNTIYVGDNHAETQASQMVFTIPSLSSGVLSRILCHNHSGPYPPTGVATGAVVANSGNNALQITGASLYFYGIAFKGGVGSSSGSLGFQVGPAANQSWLCFDNCSLVYAATSGGSILQISPTTFSGFCYVLMNNTTIGFGAPTQFFQPIGLVLVWQNTGQILASGSSVPNPLYNQGNSTQGLIQIVMEALDLSQITGTIYGAAAQGLGSVLIKDCKLNASAVVAGQPIGTGQTVQVVRSDSGAAAYKSVRYQYEGTETTETSITRVGGATDPTGQAQSRKIVTTANSQWLRPFKAEPYAIWNPTTAANVTVTVCGTINAGAPPNNDDIWLEVEYLGSASFPLGTLVNTTKANLLAANAAVASDSSTWNNAPSSGGDPYWRNVTLLLGFEGANNSTGAPGMTDESPAANGTATPHADSISTTQFKFGASSLASPGGAGITFPDSTNFALGSAPFTIEAWIYPSSLTGSQFIVGKFGSSSPNLGWTLYANGAVLAFNVSTTGADNLTPVTGGTLVINTWQHVCVDFDGVKYRLYLNGVMVASSATLYTIFNPAKPLAIASNSDGSFGFAGWFDEVRLTKGSARYASDSGFTVPASTFPRVGNWAPFKLVAVLSAPQPGFAGYIEARVRAAKSSTTYYIDPKIVLS